MAEVSWAYTPGAAVAKPTNVALATALDSKRLAKRVTRGFFMGVSPGKRVASEANAST
jgi:hypothetical protein